ncbi:SIR2 family protein [candidate division WOR-3 bacterium]|nr:SIR2 family protein [candidate division WOR-3 bacterium]
MKAKNIPDIPEVLDPIIESVSRGKLVVFVGAGVSRIIGGPSWKKFSVRLLRYLYENKGINFHELENLRVLDPRKLLSICNRIIERKRIKPPDFSSLLNAAPELKKKYQIHEMLYSFNAIYVTTNFDNYLDEIANTVKPEPLTFLAKKLESQPSLSAKSKVFYSKDELLRSNLQQGNVLHLHGSISDINSMVITTAKYLQHYQQRDKPAALLEEIFNQYTVLFVGYGLEEYEILEYIVSKGATKKGTLNHFMLYPMFRNEMNLFELQKMYYTDLGIELIPYPIEENGYEQLVTVLQEWAKRIGPVARPQSFYDRIRLIDEVI